MYDESNWGGTVVLVVVAAVGILTVGFFWGTTVPHQETIVVVGVAGAYVEDPAGDLWELQNLDPWTLKTLKAGDTLDIEYYGYRWGTMRAEVLNITPAGET
jgi:hypothetical protein